MKNVTLGSTGITVPQNGFGALPIQRISEEAAARLLQRAWEGGMRFYDTAHDYSDSEKKMGKAFRDLFAAGKRREMIIATKTHANTPDGFRRDLETSLKSLGTDYIDIYQFHQMKQCRRPGDGSGMYECMLEAKEQGMIRHIGCTAHGINAALECVDSGLYETMMFPFSYLSGEPEMKLLGHCRQHNVGFIAMKGLAGGLITRYEPAMAFMQQFDNVLPIWGIQREKELDQWLSCMDRTPEMTDEIRTMIENDRKELSGEFCRGCGYCMPCPAGIQINQCARMALMLRRMPSQDWLTEKWQREMKKIEGCLNCRACTTKCPYGLSTPELLKKNLEDYKKVLAGEVSVK